jgi:predicted Holliday junction resolvase-like endonuclease
LREQVSRQLQMQAAWREKELATIRREQTEIANKEVLAQLQHWREQELTLARKQQLEIARSEALVQLEQWKVEHTQVIRQDAIQKSQAVTLGKITEHFVPYMPDFAYNPKDARFLGSPIDFIVFDGLNDGEIKGIVLVEVKTGSSALSSRERLIRDAVQSGKVQWIELRPQLETASVITGQPEDQSMTDTESTQQAVIDASIRGSESTPSARLILKRGTTSQDRAPR